MTRKFHILIAAMVCVFGVVLNCVAKAPPSATTQPATHNRTNYPTTQPNAELIEKQLLEQLGNSPLDSPTAIPPTTYRTNAESPPTIGSDSVEPNVIGVAPGQEIPKLRREGEFIVNRRGRVVPASNGHHILFVFEADSDQSPEPPMILAACQMLQNMEEIVRERGDQIEFVVSGQILVYRGSNHLLPTMMRLAIDHGNLGH